MNKFNLSRFRFTKNEIRVLAFFIVMFAAGYAYQYFFKDTSSDNKAYSYTEIVNAFNSLKEKNGMGKEKYLEFNDNDIDSQYKLLDFNNNNFENPSIPDSTQTGRLDLNKAAFEDLLRLPGIGEKIAGEIIAYRKYAGSFNNIEELLSIKGIGYAKFQNLRKYVFIETEN